MTDRLSIESSEALKHFSLGDIGIIILDALNSELEEDHLLFHVADIFPDKSSKRFIRQLAGEVIEKLLTTKDSLLSPNRSQSPDRSQSPYRSPSPDRSPVKPFRRSEKPASPKGAIRNTADDGSDRPRTVTSRTTKKAQAYTPPPRRQEQAAKMREIEHIVSDIAKKLALLPARQVHNSHVHVCEGTRCTHGLPERVIIRKRRQRQRVPIMVGAESAAESLDELSTDVDDDVGGFIVPDDFVEMRSGPKKKRRMSRMDYARMVREQVVLTPESDEESDGGCEIVSDSQTVEETLSTSSWGSIDSDEEERPLVGLTDDQFNGLPVVAEARSIVKRMRLPAATYVGLDRSRPGVYCEELYRRIQSKISEVTGIVYNPDKRKPTTKEIRLFAKLSPLANRHPFNHVNT
ncbi:MAG: hypothetical protein KVP17_003997 [Porospora cf. gigantea B]|nr:MAG: hypothetical protein KVP17_003997 [Porospora cf. gigantea B]